ncbi:MAG TPA: DinB family protein [Anaerolineaceae bacterium]|nr:DinB family protein [Anaerolineaceae bacterium]
MTHPLVDQLRFTRSEFKRCLKGLTNEDAAKRFMPMNCIAWNVGHLAWHEQRYFVTYGQGEILIPELNELFAFGAPASTPNLEEMLKAWKKITRAADPYLDSITTQKLTEQVIKDGKPIQRYWGNLLQRVIYHYWYHTGENAAIRQVLGHTDLPQFVGSIDTQAPYRPE